MTAHAFPADPTLEALRVQRDTYAAFGGQAAVRYDKLRDELAVTKQRPFRSREGATSRQARSTEDDAFFASPRTRAASKSTRNGIGTDMTNLLRSPC